MEPQELATTLNDLLAWARESAPAQKREPELRRRVSEHLGTDPARLEVVSRSFSDYDAVNVQLALDAMDDPRELLGLSIQRGFRIGLAELAAGASSPWGGPPEPGPAEYSQVRAGDRVIACLKAGLLLVRTAEGPLVVLVGSGDEHDMNGVRLQAMAVDKAIAEKWLIRLRELMRELNVYRGKVLSFGSDEPFGQAMLSVRSLPEVPRERIVLPQRALERIERHTEGFSRHRDALRAGGRHMRRGMLLHGPPGTGKTLTVMYLAGRMPDRTVVLLTGSAIGLVGAACKLARDLEPAMVVIEDVDLIAEDREMYDTAPLLFELLNAMDGLDEDADIVFVLTTNRPGVLEPALASRPGRVDLAVELPLPDAAARRRLLALYGEGLQLDVPDWEPVAAVTDGTSPAFIRELLRHAALSAAEAGEPRVGTHRLLSSCAELKEQSGELTASLLGARRPDFNGEA